MATSRILSLLTVVVLIPACQTKIDMPDLNGIYTEVARHQHHLRNPIIVIPGVLGSALKDEDSGDIVWGAFSGQYANPKSDRGAREIAIPMELDKSLEELTDFVVTDGVLESFKVRVFGFPFNLRAYANILAALGVGGYRDQDLGLSGAIDYGEDHFTCFQFPYDWRRDNIENAKRLHEFIEEKRAYVQGELHRQYGIEDSEVRFDIVAHSMGGLIARYYLRYGNVDIPKDGSAAEVTWAGAKHVERLIMVGTPNAGAPQALIELVDGKKFGPMTPHYDPVILATMPSAYQLLPRTRHKLVRTSSGESIDLFDVSTWEKYQWGLANDDHSKAFKALLARVPEGERSATALDHLKKSLDRAGQLHRALDVPATPPSGTSIYMFAGDAVETDAVLAVDEATAELSVLETGPGDGTVLRASALMDERMEDNKSLDLVSPIEFEQVTFVFADHIGLTKDPAFTDNVIYILLEDP